MARDFLYKYFIGTALLVMIHILLTQKWAAPFPRSNTKSKISFSRGWAQEGLIVVPYVTTYASRYVQCLQTQKIYNISAWKYFRRYFWFRYYINTALLLMIHIICTQKWAAQYNAPLRSGKHTMIGKFINNK